MATEDLNPPSANAHGDELPPRMPLGQPGAHGADPNSDGAWVAAQAQGLHPGPSHTGPSYQAMSHDPPGDGTHAGHPYDTYKHEGCE
jgi:hypothetical protein